MTVVDLHPEDLIEKDAKGELEAAERARLEAHLRHCMLCRFERQVRADFVDELSSDEPAETVGLDPENLEYRRGTIDSSVIAIGHQALDPRTPHGRTAIRLLPKAKTAWLFAAAALLVGGVATAMVGNDDWSRLVRRASVSAPAPAPVDERPAPPPHRSKPTRLPVLPAPVLDVPGETVVEPPTPVEPAAKPLPHARVVVPTPVAAPPPAPSAPELLDAENSARQRGEYARALDIHRDLESLYPTSREALVSREVVGRLLLDRGDTTRALANFDAYLATGTGDLREEAMIGRATALDRLGRNEEAARAWDAILTAFPSTPYASHARARLESLSGR